MAPFIRIFLRYATGPLILLGWILPEEQAEIIADPELVFWITQGVGWCMPVVAEGFYLAAKRLGWRT